MGKDPETESVGNWRDESTNQRHRYECDGSAQVVYGKDQNRDQEHHGNDAVHWDETKRDTDRESPCNLFRGAMLRDLSQ